MTYTGEPSSEFDMHFFSSLSLLCFDDLKPGLSYIISTSFDKGYVFP